MRISKVTGRTVLAAGVAMTVAAWGGAGVLNAYTAVSGDSIGAK